MSLNHHSWGLSLRIIAYVLCILPLSLASKDAPADIATKLLSAEDTVAIQQVLGRYAIALNSNDWEAYGNCFTEDSVQEWATSSNGSMAQKVIGRAGFVKMMAGLPQYRAGTNDHQLINSVIWRDSGGVVRAWSYYVAETAEGHIRRGEYLDIFTKTKDGWKISYRRGNQRSLYGQQSKEWYGSWWLSGP